MECAQVRRQVANRTVAQKRADLPGRVAKAGEGKRGAPAVDADRETPSLIRGRANYHRCSVAGRTFSTMSHSIWQMLWQWAKRRHRNKPKCWIYDRCFTKCKNR